MSNPKTGDDTAFPIRRFTEVYHVGTFEPKDKGARGSSLEGNGLSVSRHPESWVAIARLGGLPWWKLEKFGAQTGQFLDAHALKKGHHQQVDDWALSQGLLQPLEIHELTWYDDELGTTLCAKYLDKEKALLELDCAIDEGSQSHALTSSSGLVQTEKLTDRIGFEFDVSLARSMALTLFVEDKLELDGVWWNDLLSPSHLSAPRGVINRKKLPSWKVTKINVPY